MKDNISELEKGLNSVNSDMTELKSNLEEKADAARLEALHYEIAPIETRRPIKVGYHDALRALQSVPLLAVSFVSQHESSRVFGYLLHKKKEFA